MTEEVSAGLMVLIGAYVSVIGIKASKEVFYFILNHILVALWKWMLNVISAIGRFWIHVWGLNFVYRKKD
jgi:drug/metabolite transporter superfamily protein YnfA